jgi:16S rRNA (guanine527-N7)-methyltransferase
LLPTVWKEVVEALPSRPFNSSKTVIDVHLESESEEPKPAEGVRPTDSGPINRGTINSGPNDSQSLQEAIERYGLVVPQPAMEQIERYCLLLWAWNEKINLTRHTNFDLFARRDLLDCIKLAAHIPPDQDVLDIGTGGGVPGLVLAMLRPDLSVHVCDNVAKKANVVQDLVKRLDLPVAVFPQRVQLVLEDLRFHTLVTRATGSLAQLLTWLADHWASFDCLLAIKGPRWVEERGEARHRGLMRTIDLRCLESYPMPDTQSESAIVALTYKRGT